MAFCTNCGTQNPDTSQFCTTCGSRMGAPPLAPAAPPVMATPLVPQGMTPLPPTLPVGWPAGATYAVWTDRVIGYLIDSILVGVGMAILYGIAGAFLAMISGLGGHDLAGGMCCMLILLFPIASLLVGVFNRVYLVSTRGASIGQGVMRLKVVDANGNLLTMGTAFIRLLAQVGLSFVPIVGPLLDLMWPLWDEKRQTLHDKAVGCYVLKLA